MVTIDRKERQGNYSSSQIQFAHVNVYALADAFKATSAVYYLCSSTVLGAYYFSANL